MPLRIVAPPSATPKEAARRAVKWALDQGFEPAGLHAYTNADGSVAFWRIRAKHPATGDKIVRPMRLAQCGYVLAEPEFTAGKPVYRLHSLLGREDDSVFVVEGENCADAIARLGLCATTSGGADSARSCDWRPLAGRRVIVWPDADAPGARYCADVLRLVAPLAAAVVVIDPRRLGLAEGGDVVDWLQVNPGATGSDLLGLAVQACALPSEAR
jgi:hypothetical protein